MLIFLTWPDSRPPARNEGKAHGLVFPWHSDYVLFSWKIYKMERPATYRETRMPSPQSAFSTEHSDVLTPMAHFQYLFVPHRALIY